MANSILITESTLTDRYQTTVPDAVRKALHLGKREKIRYTIQPDGNVLLSRADQDEADPVLGSFLTFLANDIQANPQRLKAATPELASRIQSLVGGIEVDLDAPLDDEDE
ncbi:type II toxin-antitoxin system PrlF family antitoxin [Marinobacterium sp. D7]|uniref:type II toxin-antitoxin system PrlF family antitoxin n=1 Tax=Marinobacterium ramblicola TaxID=2849041 RepID=UPI001C2D675C|nr:type II toxin-antitoxin system PrlF family antitoxin [Marinobacterium ramblicola]MBV1790128.1 type II toxin-antitoxin system PrlF family antitoxin [Marinobacterium ramblicola]